MKLGLLVESEEGLDWERWRATYRAAERLGFESLWMSDHLASPWDPACRGLDPWVALAVAAAETSRIRLGPLVSPITFHQPALLTRMVESLSKLAPQRFVLGLGLGWNAEEHARFGVPFPSVDERARLLETAIQTIPRTGVPLLIGGAGHRRTLPLVARYADEWNLTTASLDAYETASARLTKCCLAIERDPGKIQRSVALGFLIGRTDAELQERARRMQSVVPPLDGMPVTEVAEASRRIGWVAGTPAQVIDKMRLLADAGVYLAILGHYDLNDLAALELIASEVMPALV